MNDIMTLTPPEVVSSVSTEKALSMVPVSTEQHEQLNQKVAEFIAIVISAEINSESFKEKLNIIHNMGNNEIRMAASMSNRMLERPANTLNQGGVFDENAPIGKTLVDLRKTVESLDPSQQDLLSPRKLLGLIPFGNKLQNYFYQYQSAQTQLNKIVQALYNGQDELRKDNAVIETEKALLWDTMGKLEQYIYLGKQIDATLEIKIAEIELQSSEKARIVKEEMLFYVRQKVQDLLTQLAVSIQGYLALDMVRKNNLELIKGVDRATTTTISALRTAVMVAQALNNQKLVLDQINALNTTTSNMIAGTAKLLKQQASDIGNQAANATIELDKLKAAFADIYETMDMMANYKVQALANMQKTVNVLSTEVSKAQVYLAKTQQQSPSLLNSNTQNNAVSL
ncbi:MAG: toxic anion resistance protein [Methylococcaceae bacterium]